VGAWCSG